MILYQNVYTFFIFFKGFFNDECILCGGLSQEIYLCVN